MKLRRFYKWVPLIDLHDPQVGWMQQETLQVMYDGDTWWEDVPLEMEPMPSGPELLLRVPERLREAQLRYNPQRYE